MEATERFDGVRPDALRVPAGRLEASRSTSLDPAVRDALEEATRRARLVHEAQLRPDVTVEVAPGSRVTERWVPVAPGRSLRPRRPRRLPELGRDERRPGAGRRGRDARRRLPAAAGRRCRTPRSLAACALLGVDEVYAVGGAQAIAMFAYGTESCPPVDVVTGPGNVYVTAAKRLVRGIVGVDAEAGPTEIAVLADDTAPTRCTSLPT